MQTLRIWFILLVIAGMSLSPAQEWTMFRQNPMRTGYSPETGDLKKDFLVSWTFTAPNGIFGSPAVADVNGDGKPEIVVPLDKVRDSPQESLIVLSNTGRVLWRFVTRGSIHSSPAVGDVDNDGDQDIVFGTNAGEVYALDGATGQELWSINTIVGAFRSSPLIYDLDKDNNAEVFIGSSNGSLYKIDGESGITEWRYQTADEISSSPSLADLDGDGDPELFFASQSGVVYAVEGDSSLVWSADLGSSIIFSTGAVIPAEGAQTVVIGTQSGKLFFVKDGEIAAELDVNASISSSPGISPREKNIIIFGTTVEEDLHGVYLKYSKNKIYGADENEGLLWSVPTGGWSVFSSPALADIDRDGEIEAVIGTREGRLYVIGTESGEVEWDYLGGTGLFASPALADLDLDGDLEIIIAYLFSNQIKVLDSPDKPDLVVNSITLSNEFPKTGDNLVIEVNVSNQGDVYAEASKLFIYRRSPTLDQLIGDISVQELEVGEVAELNLSWEFRAPEGEMGFYVLADGDNEVNESNEENNGLYRPLRNDLFISDYDVPETVEDGAEIDVLATIGNRGRFGVRGVRVVLLVGEGEDAVEVASGVVDIGAGEETSKKFSFTYNSSYGRILSIVVDPDNEVHEADETNNMVSGEFGALAVEEAEEKSKIMEKSGATGPNPILIVLLVVIFMIVFWKKGLKRFKKKTKKKQPAPQAESEGTEETPPGTTKGEIQSGGVTTQGYTSQMPEAPPSKPS